MRDYWALLLTIIASPFFIFVYYLIATTATVTYDVSVINLDKPKAAQINYGDSVFSYLSAYSIPQSTVAFSAKKATNLITARKAVEDKSADMILIISENFSDQLLTYSKCKDSIQPSIKVIGNASNPYYSVTMILSLGVIQQYLDAVTGNKQSFLFNEEFTTSSSKLKDFDIYVPGLLIFSIVMLILSCAMIIIREVENKSIRRLMITKMTVIDYLVGLSVVQLIVGILTFTTSLVTAKMLGYQYFGSLWAALFVGLITVFAIIGISLLIVAFSNSISTVLTLGNFPLFILMFFSGAMLPMPQMHIFNLGPISLALNDILPATPAVNALNKILTSGQTLFDVRYDLYKLITISIIYYLLGIWLFKKRHLKVY